ncbi:MAG: hypothetical protein WCT41_00425 [Candidatus Paceibacterota bacterium]|jgi:hypothetical protein
MDQTKPEPTLEQSIKQVMQILPPPVRSYLAQGKYTAVAQSLTAKYGLRVDQGGVLEREIMLLLMGIENPEEFNQALVTEANLNQQTVSSIVQDVNAQVFSPLREEMRKGVEALGKKPPQIPPAAPARQPVVAPIPAPAAGAGQSTSHFHLENKLPPSPRSAESAAVRPIPPRPSAQVPVAASALNAPVPALSQQPIKPIPAQPPVGAQPGSVNVLHTEPKPVQQIPVPPRPPVSNIAPLPPKVVLPSAVGANLRPNAQSFSKPMDGSKLLEDHEEPHIELNKNKTPSSSAETPLQQALRTVLPPPRNLPGAMPPPDIIPPSRPAPSAPKVPQAPVKPYSADPYREPIE